MDWTTLKYFVNNIDNNIKYLEFNYLALAKCRIEFCNKAFRDKNHTNFVINRHYFRFVLRKNLKRKHD